MADEPQRREMSRRKLLQAGGATVAAALGARALGIDLGRPASRNVRGAGAGGSTGATAGAGGSASGLVARHGALLRGLEQSNENRYREGRFGLMFKQAPPFRPPDALLEALAAQMVDPTTGPAPELDNPGIPAGFTFIGQFLDHDITLDTTPLSSQESDPQALTNFRSPRYDLDSVYGGGPAARPELYDHLNPAKLRIGGGGGQPDDVPRTAEGTALLGDPRNDENLIVAQLHLAFLKFHNRLVDHLGGGNVFAQAQRLARWHWQWVVLHDVVPRLVGPEVAASVLVERPGRAARPQLRFYKPQNVNQPMMPLEHAVAAYRFGHSMVRGKYRMNAASPLAGIFGPQAALDNLNGGRPLPKELVAEWWQFFEVPGRTPPQRSRKLDPILSAPLFTLPDPPPPAELRSLAERNLKRGSRVGLGSGQEVARAMGIAPLTNAELGLSDDAGWQGQAPLWFYVLKEAELRGEGRRLGPVGARIVAEVLVGLAALDKTSYLSVQPDFRPASPIAPETGRFSMVDLLGFAGVL